MLLALFIPLGFPAKDKFHVAPVGDVAVLSTVEGCTAERLGDGVTPEACRKLLASGAGLIVRFTYAPRPCGGDRCTTATDVNYAIEPAAAQPLWPVPRTSAAGTHSLVIDPAGRHDFCVTLTAVRLPENASSQMSRTCIHVAFATPKP